jgi:predicted PurR-regulated permease PerM
VFDYVKSRGHCCKVCLKNVATNRPKPISRNTTLLSVVLVVAVLYFGREIFIPVALAVLFSFLLAPLVTRLRHWGWWRVPSVLTVVTLAFVLMAILGALMTSQLTDLSHKLPEYQHNIHQKLESIRASSNGVMGRVSRLMHNFTEELKPYNSPAPAAPGVQRPVPVEIRQGDISPLQLVPKILGSVIGILLTGVIVIVFVIFMLLQQEDLRDRVIRLVGWRQLNITTKALDEAGQRVSRYLLAQLVVNATYGIVAGVALYFLGVPNPVLWGVLAVLFRYIPYLGIWIAAIMPAAVVFAIDPGWLKPVGVFGIYVGIDLLTYNFVEPLVYGNTTGLTPLAILITAVFWAWLWGPVGLLLATPLTVCVAVIGRYVPSLQFLGVLLSDEEVLTPEKRLYQRLLAGNVEEAAEILEEFLKGKSLEELYDVVITPALGLAEEDCLAGRLDDEQQQFVFHNARLLVEDIAPRAHDLIGGNGSKQRGNGKLSAPEKVARLPVRVLSLPARGEADELAALMLVQLSSARGISAKAASASALASERLEEAGEEKIEVVCVSTVVPDGCLHTRYLCKRLREQFPDLRIVAAILIRDDARDVRRRELSIAANEVAVTLSEAAKQIQSLVSVPATPAGQTAFSS